MMLRAGDDEDCSCQYSDEKGTYISVDEVQVVQVQTPSRPSCCEAVGVFESKYNQRQG